MVTEYTFCDVAKEKQVQKMLAGIVQDLKTHYELEKTELEFQKKQCSQLWKYTIRHRILQDGAPGISVYPDETVERVECEMMSVMHHHIRNIHKSNKKLEESIDSLTPLYLKLDEMNGKIDWMAKSGAIRGNEIYKPLAHYVENVSDLRKYFKKNVVERRVLEEMLDIRYTITVEAYRAVLDPPEEFDEIFAAAVCFTHLLEPK